MDKWSIDEVLNKCIYDWKDIHDKVLKIKVLTSIDGTVVYGIDENDKYYVLRIDVNEESIE